MVSPVPIVSGYGKMGSLRLEPPSLLLTTLVPLPLEGYPAEKSRT